jgi:cytochrome c oxidase assembly protein subunit 11
MQHVTQTLQLAPDQIAQKMHATQKKKIMTRKLLLVVCMMFAFGYALVPLYRAICDLTGINILAFQEEVGKNKITVAVNSQVDLSREITIDFDSNEAGGSQALWSFKPAQRSVKAHPGELMTVQYELKNLQNRSVVGQAIPSYLPARAAQHFSKVECFCFKQQTLAPGEVRTFPVVFSIDPALGKDVSSITLSYTFFEVKGAL